MDSQTIIYGQKVIRPAEDPTKTNATFDNFRRSISEYAIAKDKKGNYIYDETIAEAFHDVYLNKESARPASIYIVNELKQYLGG